MTNLAHTLPATAPHLRLIMSDQDHEHPDTPTDIAPARDTSPPDPIEEAAADAHMAALRPARLPSARLNADGMVVDPETMQELLYNELIKRNHLQNQRDEDMLNPNGPFASLIRGLVDAGADKVAHKLEPRFAGIERELATARDDAAKAMRIASEALNRVASLETLLSKQKPPQS